MLSNIIFVVLVVLYGWLDVHSPVPLAIGVLISALFDSDSRRDSDPPIVKFLGLIGLGFWLGLVTSTIPWALGFPCFFGCCLLGGLLSPKK